MIYEIVAILSPKLSDDQVAAEQGSLRQLIEQAGGKVLREDAWGKRELAYEIQHLSHGIYVQTDFEAEPSLVAELDRQLKLREAFVRFLVVKKEKGLGTLSDFTESDSTSETTPETGGEETRRTTEEATATPDVLVVPNSKKKAAPALLETVSKDEPVKEVSASEKETAETEKAAAAEEKAESKKADMKELDKKLDDILDSTLDEEVK